MVYNGKALPLPLTSLNGNAVSYDDLAAMVQPMIPRCRCVCWRLSLLNNASGLVTTNALTHTFTRETAVLRSINTHALTGMSTYVIKSHVTLLR